jgi:hypothetical protein
VGVVVAYLVTNLLSPKEPPGMAPAPAAPPASSTVP